MNELALFAGAGGGILGGHLLGWRTVCAVEVDAYCASVIMARQNDGCLPPFPVWDDVCTFDGYPWRGIVDVVSGGFPCQDISTAGKGTGINGERSGLWGEMARIIREVRPRFVLVENSPLLTVRGLDRVLGDLAAMGYDAQWGVLGAIDAGAPHQRDRIWIVAHADHYRRGEQIQHKHGTGGQTKANAWGDGEVQPVANPDGDRKPTEPIDAKMALSSTIVPNPDGIEWGTGADRENGAEVDNGGWWLSESGLVRVAYGVAHRMDRIRALGNGQVPAVVRLAWGTLAGETK